MGYAHALVRRVIRGTRSISRNGNSWREAVNFEACWLASEARLFLKPRGKTIHLIRGIFHSSAVSRQKHAAAWRPTADSGAGRTESGEKLGVGEAI